jgi:SpoVK/Ycf46/Vps4 family AAA+-type ATPase
MGNNDQERMVWRSRLFKTDGVLQRLSLATMGDSMDIFGMTELVASDEVMRVFYPDVDWSFKPVVGQEDVGRLIVWDSIVEEKLFYNEADREQLEGIGKMMEVKSFDRIIKQLKQRRLGTGMPILLFGPPGTGKTASVMQWGRINQRSIFLVDISEIRGKYMGDTEKNAKRIFQRYRQLVKSEKRCPILLFNEADGVLSKRIGVERSVDMANNALQNILLQELENFEGILVATTNLLDNLDAAFERRFLWKVALNQPDQEVQLAMMQHVLSGDMKSQDIVSIGLKYKLTGGQISNIYRKFVLDIVMHPKKNKIALLEKLCEKETQYALKEGRGKIGF